MSGQPARPPDPPLPAVEPMPMWRVLLPLGVVVVALGALVVVPPLITERNAELRAERDGLYTPLGALIGTLERTTGAELAAARGYALTGDPFFVDRFLGVHAYGNAAAARVDSLSTVAGGEVAVAATRLLETRQRWAAANFGQTRAAFREGITEHQRHFEETMAAGQRLGAVVAQEVRAHTERIEATERLRERVTLLLAAIALVAAAATAWLAQRLRQSERLVRRLYEDAHRKDLERVEELGAVNASLEERVRERTREARTLSRALTLAEQRERRALAQVLHDDLQQMLFATQLQVKGLEGAAPALDAEALQRALEQVHDALGEAIGATRRLTVDLSPPLQAGETLAEALRWLAAHARERFGLAVEVRAPDGLAVPTEELRLLLFQTVRELVFNVVKHAGADRTTLTVAEEGGELVVEVADEGAGFDPEAAAERPASTIGGFGLRGSAERIALFGGSLRIDSAPGRGTRARVSVPLGALHGEGGGEG